MTDQQNFDVTKSKPAFSRICKPPRSIGDPIEKLMDLETISNTSMCDRWRLYGITATASFEYVLSCELVPSAVTT